MLQLEDCELHFSHRSGNSEQPSSFSNSQGDLCLCMFAKDRDEGRPPLSISVQVIWLSGNAVSALCDYFNSFHVQWPNPTLRCLAYRHTALTVRTVKIAALCRETLTHRCEPVWSNMILGVCCECATTPHPQTLSHPAQLFTVYCALISKGASSQTNILD